MNGAAVGTAVTPVNLLAATEGPADFEGWFSGSPYQTFQTSVVALPAAITVNGGKTHTCGFATQSLAHDGTGNFSVSSMKIPLKTELVFGGWISNLPPNQQGDGDYFDVAQVVGAKGFSATIQIQSGTDEPACGAYGIEIESSGTKTIHSACIETVVPGGTYFVQMHVIYSSSGTCGGPVAAPCAEMNVYTTTGSVFTQLGSTVSVALSGVDTIYTMNFGNNEGGQFTGNLYFQDWMVDYTNSEFPNLPH